MQRFAETTGLTSSEPPRRYLWTDAYAVCNYLALYQRLQDDSYFTLAADLISQVHETLGRHRSDDVRKGWLSGLHDHEARQHPTIGGLRIGKKLPERSVDDPFDQQLEWERDGQYFHYLTKWAHALHQMWMVSAEGRYQKWAAELMRSAVQHFRIPGGLPRLAWKMSVDLGHSLVPQTGHHDPLDGWITVLVLLEVQNNEALSELADELALMCRGPDWTTDDTLGLGGLLFDATRLSQLTPNKLINSEMLKVLRCTLSGLTHFSQNGTLSVPAGRRLGFRELGLAAGLHGLDLLRENLGPEQPDARACCEDLRRYLPVAQQIEDFWLQPDHRFQSSWRDHQDINDVMLVSSLLAPAIFEVR